MVSADLLLYEFSQDLWQMEIASGFAGIASTRSIFATKLAKYLQQLAPADQKAFARAFSRRWNNGALSLLSEKMSTEDEKIVASFMHSARTAFAGSDSEGDFKKRAFESAGRLSKSQKGELEEALIGAFAITRTAPEKLSSATWVWRVNLPTVLLTVMADLPPRRPCVDVSYKIQRGSGESIRNQYSFYAALGLRSQTEWVITTAKAACEAVVVAAEVTQRLLHALSRPGPS